MSYTERTFEQLLDDFSGATPTPGGGSAAAVSSALGTALIAMAAGITANSKKFADRKERMEAIAGDSQKLLSRMKELVTLDSTAYDGVSAAFKLPKDTDEQKDQRKAAIQEALKKAAEVPFETLAASIAALKLAAEVVENGNPNCVTDAVAGALMIETGLNAAKMNVCVNLESISDEAYCSDMNAKLSIARSDACVLSNRIRMVYNALKGCNLK